MCAPSMALHADARLPFSRELVFVAYRDELPKLLPYLPNVRRIEVTSRKENGPVVELVNEWRGGGGIPPGGRPAPRQSRAPLARHAARHTDNLPVHLRHRAP